MSVLVICSSGYMILYYFIGLAIVVVIVVIVCVAQKKRKQAKYDVNTNTYILPLDTGSVTIQKNPVYDKD